MGTAGPDDGRPSSPSPKFRRVSSFNDSVAEDSPERIQAPNTARSTPSPPLAQSPSKGPWIRSDPLFLRRWILKPLVPLFKAPKTENLIAKKSDTDPPHASSVTQNLTFKEHEPITSLAISPDRRQAAIVGKNIFKTLEVRADHVAQQQDIYHGTRVHTSNPESRLHGATIQSYDFLSSPTTKDIVWPGGSFSRNLLAASTDGLIYLYNLDKEGYDSTRLHQHNRQVHKLSVNSFEPSLFLSGSQDATVRLWDLRNLSDDRNGMKSSACFQGNSDAVRDVQWSPTNIHEFVLCTDLGVVQQWDIRKHNAPLKRMKAHDAPCHSVHYHQDGKHLLSGGADKDIKVWNLSTSERKIMPKMSLRTPYPVKHARWRPVDGSRTSGTKNSWQQVHIATSSAVHDDRVLFWDLRRPYNPILILDHYGAVPNSILWQSDHVLWSTAADNDGRGIFTQTNVSRLKDLSERSLPPPTVISLEADGTLWQVFNEPAIHVRKLSGPRHEGAQSGGDSEPLRPALMGVEEPKTARSRAKTFLQSTFRRQDDEQPKFIPTERPFELTPSSWGRAYRIPGIVTPLSTMGELLANLKFIPELPYNANSTEQHLVIYEILIDNFRAASAVNRPEVASFFYSLSVSVREELEQRATYKRRQRTGADEAAFVADDFTPTGLQGFLTDPSTLSMSCDVLLRQANSDFDEILLVWLFLNLFPWFPSTRWRHSDENTRNHLIRAFHNNLLQTGQWNNACAIRNAWARVCPDVEGVGELPSLTPARIRDGTGECGLCLGRRDETMWVWCQNCGHSLHYSCGNEWFLMAGGNACPLLGCRCTCVFGV